MTPVLSSEQHGALSALFAPYARSDAPGVVVGLAQHGVPLYRRAFGMASLEHARALTITTRLRIGSMSKHFTCLAALLLCEDGRLDADAAIGRYLPELPPAAGAPTLRQLMSHLGGQRCSLDLAILTQGLAVSPRGASLAAQLRQREANFPPGERMMYSNGGYHLLSLAIERVSGMPFDTFLQTRIFTPMRMVDTASVPNDMTIAPGVATMHLSDGQGGFLRGIFPSMEILGEGAIISTVDDMLRWTAHVRGDKLVGNADTWAQMLAMPVFSSGQRSQYALGLKQNIYRGIELTHHSGGVVGGTSQMMFSTAHGLDIVLLSNGAVDAPRDLAHRVIDIMLAGELSGDGPPIPASAAVHAARLGSYRSTRSDAIYTLGDRNGALVLTGFLCPSLPLPLYEAENGEYDVAIEASSDGAIAIRWSSPEASHDLSKISIAHCGHAELFERLGEPPALTSRAIAALRGSFESHDAHARAVIDFDQEQLVLRMQGAAGGCEYRLIPLANKVFGLFPSDPLGIMTGLVTLTQDAANAEINGFRIDTRRTRRIAFTRINVDA